MQNCKLLLITVISVLFSVRLSAGNVDLEDSRLYITGAPYKEILDDGSLEFFRFSKTVRDRMRKRSKTIYRKSLVTSGITLSINTDSKEVTFSFYIPEGAIRRPFTFVALRDDKYFKKYVFPKKSKNFEITVNNNSGGFHTFTLVFPIWGNPVLKQIRTDDGSSLKEVKKLSSGSYAACGSSETLGTGQKMGVQTYPYIISRTLNKELYNLAVGENRVFFDIIDDIAKIPDLRIMTLISGSYELICCPSLKKYLNEYEQFLRRVREVQSEVDIYCISPFSNPTVKIKYKSSETIESLSAMQKAIVEKLRNEGDEHIFFIDSADIVTRNDISSISKWGNTFSIDGAKKFADVLVREINTNLIEF